MKHLRETEKEVESAQKGSQQRSRKRKHSPEAPPPKAAATNDGTDAEAHRQLAENSLSSLYFLPSLESSWGINVKASATSDEASRARRSHNHADALLAASSPSESATMTNDGIYEDSSDDQKQPASETSGTDWSETPKDATIVEPTCHDVLFGRGKTHRKQPGNQRLQLMADVYRQRYIKADRSNKTNITKTIVDIIKSDDEKRGRFLKFCADLRGWVEVSDEVARKKVGHTIRDGKSKPHDPINPDFLEELPLRRDHTQPATEKQPASASPPARLEFEAEEAAMIVDIFASSATTKDEPGEEENSNMS